MREAEIGRDDTLDADIAFHVAVLYASGNPFYAQFRDVVDTALRTSIRFTNRIAGRSASIDDHAAVHEAIAAGRSEEHTSELQSLMRISSAVFCLKKKKQLPIKPQQQHH